MFLELGFPKSSLVECKVLAWDDMACQKDQEETMYSHLCINLELNQPSNGCAINSSVCKKQFWCPRNWSG